MTATVRSPFTRRSAVAALAFLSAVPAILRGDSAHAQTQRRAPESKAKSNQSKSKAGEKSLYERLGGIFAIAAVVNRFSDEIITNPKLNVNPALKEWNEKEAATRLPGLKFMRTLWVAALAGGPFDYTGLPLDEAHQDFHLTADEFSEVGAEIVRALDYYKVPEREKQELVAAYMTAMDEVVQAP